MENGKMYCKHCGEIIDSDCIICPKCGKQVADLKQEESTPIIINNSASAAASASATVTQRGKECDKWIAFVLCLFLGYFGAHKFYEGKTGMGIIYLLTFGLFGIGWFIDIIAILGKPNPYYV